MEKKKTLFRLAMSMVLMAMMAWSSAQTPVNVLQHGKAKVHRSAPQTQSTMPDALLCKHQAEAQMVNVTIQMEYDATVCRPPFDVQFLNTEDCWGVGGGQAIMRNFQDGSYKGQLPVGCYDISATFSGNSTYIVIKELVDIHSDTTIVIDQSTATNHIQITAKKPNGDIFDPSIYDWSGQMTYEGNIDEGFFMNTILRKSDNKDLFGGLGLICRFDSYVNELSDRFMYEDVRCYYDYEPSVIYVVSYASMDFQFPLENDITDWEYVEEPFQPSTLGKGENECFGVNFTRSLNGLGWCFAGSTLDMTDETAKVYVNAPKRNDGYTFLLNTAYGHGEEVVTNYIDYDGNIVFSDTTIENYPIHGVPTFVEEGAKSYINNGALADIRANLRLFGFHNEDGIVAEHTYPGNPAFAFTEAQKTSNFGSGTPICLFVYNNWQSETPNWQFTYVGRYGEVREVDRLAVDLKLKVNGAEVCNGVNEFNVFMYDTSRPTGEVDITMVNENVLVDELQGRNFAQMHIDENNEDRDGPTVTMLWFKDNENRITDRFATSQDGLLEFSAGDFNAMYDENVSPYTWFDCQKPEVEVSYAPYGEDNWSELEVEEIPENFCMPCFGNFFRGSLAGVTGEALQGWFDLKIKLTDAAGNWQEQVISPAFRIDDLAYSSVATVGSDNAHEVARYTLDGRRADANTKGVVIVKMSDGTARKVIVP